MGTDRDCRTYFGFTAEEIKLIAYQLSDEEKKLLLSAVRSRHQKQSLKDADDELARRMKETGRKLLDFEAPHKKQFEKKVHTKQARSSRRNDTERFEDFQKHKMTRQEVADVLGIKAASLSTALFRGSVKLRQWKVGRAVYYDRRDVESLIADSRGLS